MQTKTDMDVGTGLVGAPACGDVMKLQIRVDPSNNTIADVKFKTFGCGSAIASSSYMTERVKGLSLEEAGKIKNTEIAKELSLPPVKLHCSMLAEDAIRSAIRDYHNKRANMAHYLFLDGMNGSPLPACSSLTKQISRYRNLSSPTQQAQHPLSLLPKRENVLLILKM